MSEYKRKDVFIENISNIASGNWGLAKTFWILHIIGMVINYFFTKSSWIVNLLMAAYSVFVIVSIWKAANKYQGKKVFPIMAKTFLIIEVAISIIFGGLSFILMQTDIRL